jgi:IMP dehydrogenase
MSKIQDNKIGLCYDDVLIVPRYSDVLTRSAVILAPNFKPFTSLDSHFKPFTGLKIPIISANMDTITGIKMAKKMQELGGFGIIHRNESIQNIDKAFKNIEPKNVFVAVGSYLNNKQRIDDVMSRGYNICVDIAHGDSYHMKKTLEYIRSKDSNIFIIAGNVATPDACIALNYWGANLVKVGVGGGSACTTRIKTGCGVPQLTAVLDCAQAGIPFIADGGIRNSGDAAKALAAGANFIMIGGMLAGTDCTPNWNYEDALLGKDMEFRGMASFKAKEATGLAMRHEEGISTKVKARFEGSTEEVIQGLVDGIKSAMSYAGCFTLQEFSYRATFMQVSSNTYKENHAHFQQ